MDHFVIHGPAILRVRMGNDSNTARENEIGFDQHRFQPSCRTVNEQVLRSK